MRRRWMIVAVLSLVGAMLAWGAVRNGDGERRFERVERRDLVLEVSIEGELEALRSTLISPPSVPWLWQFKIASLVTDGSRVRAGQKVVSFDTSELMQRRLELEANRESAITELEKAVADHERQRRGFELRLAEAEAKLRKAEFELAVPPEVAARKELETARISQQLAKTEIDHLRSAIEGLEVERGMSVGRLEGQRDLAASRLADVMAALDAMSVEAPSDGTAIVKGPDNDNKYKIGDQIWRSRPVLEIPDLEEMVAVVFVAESELAKIRPGQPVTLRLDAYPDREYGATVERIRHAVQRRSENDPRRVVMARLRLDATDRERMRPGMRVRGAIEVERVEDAVALPLEAVHSDAAGSWVWRAGLGGGERVKPEFGRRDDRYVEVLEGLDVGDRVGVGGFDR